LVAASYICHQIMHDLLLFFGEFDHVLCQFWAK